MNQEPINWNAYAEFAAAQAPRSLPFGMAKSGMDKRAPRSLVSSHPSKMWEEQVLISREIESLYQKLSASIVLVTACNEQRPSGQGFARIAAQRTSGT